MMEAEEVAYTQRAIEYFEKALDILPGGWMAMEGLARCYGENLQEYTTAIEWMGRAINNLPKTDSFVGIDFYLNHRIADWNLKIGNEQESLKAAQLSYEASQEFTYGTGSASDSSIIRSIKHYIEALYRTSQHSRIVELVNELDATDTLEPDTSLWTVFMGFQLDEYYAVDLFNKIGAIAQELEDEPRKELMKACTKKATNLNALTIADQRSIWLADQIAECQYRYAADIEESIEIWERLVNLVDQSNEVVQQTQNRFRSKAAGFLSMIFFRSARDDFDAGRDPSTSTSKIKQLAMHSQGSKRYYRASYPALILGLWLHEYKKTREDVWRACIRPSVKQALYLLSDEDPWNDQDAYIQLGQALLAAGDVLNGSIALGMTMKPLADRRSEIEQQKIEQDAQAQKTTKIGLELHEAKTEKQQNEDSNEISSREVNLVSPISELLGDNHIGKSKEAEDSALDCASQGNDKATIEAAVLRGDANGDSDDHEKDTDEEKNQRNNDDPVSSINSRFVGLDYRWLCDGPCTTSQSDYAELWFCRICIDNCFCERCIGLLRRGEISARICASDHSLIRVFPMIEEAKELTDALLQRRFEVQQRWLDDLRKTWED